MKKLFIGLFVLPSVTNHMKKVFLTILLLTSNLCYAKITLEQKTMKSDRSPVHCAALLASDALKQFGMNVGMVRTRPGGSVSSTALYTIEHGVDIHDFFNPSWSSPSRVEPSMHILMLDPEECWFGCPSNFIAAVNADIYDKNDKLVKVVGSITVHYKNIYESQIDISKSKIQKIYQGTECNIDRFECAELDVKFAVLNNPENPLELACPGKK